MDIAVNLQSSLFLCFPLFMNFKHLFWWLRSLAVINYYLFTLNNMKLFSSYSQVFTSIKYCTSSNYRLQCQTFPKLNCSST